MRLEGSRAFCSSVPGVCVSLRRAMRCVCVRSRERVKKRKELRHMCLCLYVSDVSVSECVREKQGDRDDPATHMCLYVCLCVCGCECVCVCVCVCVSVCMNGDIY